MTQADIMRKIESEGAKTRKALNLRIVINASTGRGGPVLQRFIRGKWVSVPEVHLNEKDYLEATGK